MPFPSRGHGCNHSGEGVRPRIKELGGSEDIPRSFGAIATGHDKHLAIHETGGSVPPTDQAHVTNGRKGIQD